MMVPAALAGLLLLGLAARVLHFRARAPRLADSEGIPPEVTVLLPVRDEERNVAACVASLLEQTARPRVVVIDDGSGDRTRAIARELAAARPRLTLIESGALPAGWKGKVHALETGLREVATPWLLTTDADTRHHPELLARAVATARERGLDSLSVAGRQEARGLAENLLTPTVYAALDAILGDWRRAAGGASDVANGQFFLVRAGALREIGGFAGVRGAALDDVALARRLRDAGLRHGFFRGPDLLSVRMYRGFGETFRGWRRNLGAFFAARPGPAAALLAVLLTPILLLGAAAVTGDGSAAAILWAAGTVSSTSLRLGGRHRAAFGLLYPLDALLLGACLLLGLRDAARGVLAPWKGRPVPLEDEPDPPARRRWAGW